MASLEPSQYVPTTRPKEKKGKATPTPTHHKDRENKLSRDDTPWFGRPPGCRTQLGAHWRGLFVFVFCWVGRGEVVLFVLKGWEWMGVTEGLAYVFGFGLELGLSSFCLGYC